MDWLFIVMLVLFAAYAIWMAYGFGRLRERRDVLARSREAQRLFFGGPVLHVPRWTSSSDLMAYIAGYRPLPAAIHYEPVNLDADVVTQPVEVDE